MDYFLKENDLINQAVNEIRETTGMTVEVADYPFQGDKGYDALIRMQKGKQFWDFAAEVKQTATTNTLIQLKPQTEHTAKKLLFITKYMNPIMADRFRQAGVAFIDAAGNAFLDEPGLFLFIKGNKPKATLTAWKKTFTRPFKPKGLRVTFAILCNPLMRQAKYEDIALNAKVALGTVAGVMHDLKELGYLLKTGTKEYRLMRGNELLQRWVDAYITQLRPALVIKRYQTTHNDLTWQDRENLKDINGLIGGEVAADELTHFLKPETLTIYTDEPLPPKAILKHGLREDPNGNVEVVIKFWNFEFKNFPYPQLAHPILVYADLLALDDDRLIEVAKKLLEGEYFGING